MSLNKEIKPKLIVTPVSNGFMWELISTIWSELRQKDSNNET